MSQHLDSLKVGDTIDMKGPKGHLEYLGQGNFTVKQMRKPLESRKAKHFGTFFFLRYCYYYYCYYCGEVQLCTVLSFEIICKTNYILSFFSFSFIVITSLSPHFIDVNKFIFNFLSLSISLILLVCFVQV